MGRSHKEEETEREVELGRGEEPLAKEGEGALFGY